jgi:hypothetical protein
MMVPHPYTPGVMMITNDDLINFLKNKGATLACGGCHRNEWAILGSENNPRAVLNYVMPLNTSEIKPTETYRSIVMICNNCGFMRHHSLQALLDWKLNR